MKYEAFAVFGAGNSNIWDNALRDYDFIVEYDVGFGYDYYCASIWKCPILLNDA